MHRSAALIGKCLTFDSDGVSLKLGAGMAELKYDMSGGAAVLGSTYFISQVKPPVKTVCIIGATENLYRLGLLVGRIKEQRVSIRPLQLTDIDATSTALFARGLHAW